MAPKTQARPMTEDELLEGITDALSLSGWRWFHIRRSDQAIVQGHQGWPDVFAIHPTRRIQLAMELKTEVGQVTIEQAAWIACMSALGMTCLVVRPADYDRVLGLILGKIPGSVAHYVSLGWIRDGGSVDPRP